MLQGQDRPLNGPQRVGTSGGQASELDAFGADAKEGPKENGDGKEGVVNRAGAGVLSGRKELVNEVRDPTAMLEQSAPSADSELAGSCMLA